MSRKDFGEFHCSIARTLDVIGDPWTPLILRDVHLGVDTFDDIARDLGISRALLSSRLEHLVGARVLEPRRYSEHPPRQRYEFTESGRDLVPILIALTQWGDRWRAPEGPPVMFRHECGSMRPAQLRCPDCDGVVNAETASVTPGPGGRMEPGTVVVAERFIAAMRAGTARA